MVEQGASSTASPRKPPAIAHLVDAERRAKPEPVISNGCVPMEIEIGSGSPRSKRALREQPHVVRRDDVDAGQAFSLTMKR